MASKIKKYCLPMLIVFTLILIIIMFFFTPTFGRLPQGNRLERIKQSENYKDGQFENLQPFRPQWGNVWKALLSKKNATRFSLVNNFIAIVSRETILSKSKSQLPFRRLA